MPCGRKATSGAYISQKVSSQKLFPLLHGPMDGSIVPCHEEAHPTHATSSI